MVKGVIIRYKGSYYSLIDASTTYIFSNMFEPWIWKYLQSLKQDSVFVDIGTHIGLYTVHVARLLKRGIAIAIEPNPENYKFLIRNIRLNNLENVVALNIAAWKDNTLLQFFVPELFSAGGSLVWKSKNKYIKNKYIKVKARKLDDLIKELNIKKIDLIKIDVEGAEVEVLYGMTEILTRYKPKLIVECHHKNYGKVTSYLKNLGYSVSVIPQSILKINGLILYIYAF